MGRATLFIVFTVMTAAIVVLALRLRDEQGPIDAEAVALDLVADGVAQDSRRVGDRWDVDVVRPDGSMVRVSLGNDFELLKLDEELGPAGTLASDELRGRDRILAVRAAFAEIGRGEVLSVERDSPREIEVRVWTDDGRQIEVELDHRLRVVEVDSETPRYK